MIWVSWRQHRSEAFGCLAVLAGLAIYAIVVGTSMRTAFGRDGLAACPAANGISVDQVRREATAPA
jgi:drug/metabolite transporter superfamily protein YnfA